jgi:glycosyltransferase involved in cell wall biosynthesis
VKRILHILDSLDFHGAARQLGLLVPRLPPGEFESHACVLSGDCPNSGTTLRVVGAKMGLSPLGIQSPSGVPPTILGRRWPLDPQTWWRLRCETARLRPDVVHAWGPAANVYGLAAARACGVRRFVARWGLAPAEGALVRAADRFIARHASAVVVPGPAAREACIARGLCADRLHVIADGVTEAPPPALSRAAWLGRLGLSDPCRVVGLFGPMVEAERAKDAIWAADLLKVIRDDVHLLICGDGRHHDRLVRFRDQVRIGDKVHFPDEWSDVRDGFSYLDVFWSVGGSGTPRDSILEAMAAAVPVVATDVPGAREFVVPEETGYLVRVGHRAGLARWTQHLLESPEVARRLGEAGRRRALADFPVEKMVEGHVTLYAELLP